jgi:putative spermidine/putrescine transport system permease protein
MEGSSRAPMPALHRRRRVDTWSMLTIPGLLLLVGFFGSALVFVIHRSLTDPGTENYSKIATSFYVDIFISTFRAAVIVMLVVLVLGYAYAYAMRVGPRPLRMCLIAVLIIQFSTSWLARAYAWQQLLQTNGIINKALRDTGIIDNPLQLMRNDLGMVIGTSHVLMPFMILTLYANMRQVDLATMVAAQSLGARRSQAFFRIFVPATRTGIVAGCGLVFVLTLGFYITPALLGDSSRQMISAVIVRRATQFGDFGVASALSAVLLLVTLLGLAVTGVAVSRLGRVKGMPRR